MRLGLVPLKLDHRKFGWSAAAAATKGPPVEPTPDPTTTAVFKLHVKCSRKAGAVAGTTAAELYNHSTVYSGDLEWVPLAGQAFPPGDAPRPVHADIILAKLRPGQELDSPGRGRVQDAGGIRRGRRAPASCSP